MDKGLFFFTLSAICAYFIYDDFFGKKRVSHLALLMTPDLDEPLEAVKDKVIKESVETVQENTLPWWDLNINWGMGAFLP